MTVVARKGIDSDALATAVSVLGKARGLEFMDTLRGTAARIEKKNERGAIEVYQSARWKALPKNSKVRD